MQQAVDSFDFEGEVRRQASALLAERIKYMLSAAISDLFKGPEFAQAFANAARAALMKKLQEMS